MRIRLLLLLMMIVLSACGGGAPTDQPPLPTLAEEDNSAGSTPEVSVPTDAVSLATQDPQAVVEFPTERPTFEGEIVQGDPRTLVASRTEDPNANVPFSRITLRRTGGAFAATPEPLVVEISGDGTITVNGTTRQAAAGVVENLNTLIREMNFFGVSGDFLGAAPIEGSEDFLYAITVERGDLSRTIQARDGNVPQELRTFIAALVEEGRRS